MSRSRLFSPAREPHRARSIDALALAALHLDGDGAVREPAMDLFQPCHRAR